MYFWNQVNAESIVQFSPTEVNMSLLQILVSCLYQASNENNYRISEKKIDSYSRIYVILGSENFETKMPNQCVCTPVYFTRWKTIEQIDFMIFRRVS